MKKINFSKGFTLIEILVVLSIIGILAGLIMTGFGAARKAARDTQRKSNLAQYKAVLETYSSNNNGNYPGSNFNGTSNNGATPAVATGIFTGSGPIIVEYLPVIINDPTNDASYKYNYYAGDPAVPSATSSVYVLWGLLENGSYWELCSDGRTGNAAAAPTGTTCNVTAI